MGLGMRTRLICNVNKGVLGLRAKTTMITRHGNARDESGTPKMYILALKRMLCYLVSVQNVLHQSVASSRPLNFPKKNTRSSL